MILETSWEVCNKMGGIYTVLSSRADIMTQRHPHDVCFIGPLLAQEGEPLLASRMLQDRQRERSQGQT